MLPLSKLESLLEARGVVGDEEERQILQENSINGGLLREAASEGFINVVKFFLEARHRKYLMLDVTLMCSNIGAADSNGTTPLHLAASCGHAAIVDCLLSYGAFVDIENADGETPLFVAAQKGHEYVVKLLSKNGADIDEWVEKYELAVIDVAACGGHSSIVEFLLSSGASVSKALYFSVRIGHVDVVRVLLQHNVNPDGYDLEESALQMAAKRGYRTICQLLLDAKASIEYADEAGMTALHWAVVQGHLPIVELLLERGATVNVFTRGEVELTPLGIAVRRGHKSIALLLCSYGAVLGNFELILKSLIEKGRYLAVLSLAAIKAELDMQTFTTPLHVACEMNNMDFVRYLLQRKADVNAKDYFGDTALHCACRDEESETIVELLLGHGALVNAVNVDGETPLHLVKTFGVLSTLIENGADPNIVDRRGCTALHLVSSTDSCKRILECNVLVDARDKHSITPLHVACRRGDKDIIKLLLERGASANTKCLEAHSPLHVAIYGDGDRSDVMRLLLEANASVDARDNSGDSPLHFAVREGRKKETLLLREFKARVDAVNSDGETPLNIAEKDQNEELIKILKN